VHSWDWQYGLDSGQSGSSLLVHHTRQKALLSINPSAPLTFAKRRRRSDVTWVSFLVTAWFLYFNVMWVNSRRFDGMRTRTMNNEKQLRRNVPKHLVRRVTDCDRMTGCRSTKSGSEYRGAISRTTSGRTCQRWDSQQPHAHSYKDQDFSVSSLALAVNFCRNPDPWDSSGPWCYTADPYVRWEHCDVPFCGK